MLKFLKITQTVMLVYPINKKSNLNKGFKTKNKKENVTTYIARKINNEVNLSDNE